MASGSANEDGKLSGAIVGSGRMGLKHADAMVASGGFAVAACADLDLSRAEELAARFPGASAYPDLDAMLEAARADVVVIATAGVTHADLTVAAAQSRPRGICCEKPMAVSLGQARAMVAACRASDVALIVNHQRRLSAPLVAMRRLVEEGAVGDVYLMRASFPGDILGDGTHAVDSLRWLAGDEDVRWVLGQVYRNAPDPDEPRSMTTALSGGCRYGYPVETGAVGVFEFASGVRAELYAGEMRLPGRGYQDYEVIGTKGRLWRAGDAADPPLLVEDDSEGGWREAPVAEAGGQFDPMTEAYRLFVRTLRCGAEHPLSGGSALKTTEVLMAIHESARTHTRVDLPLQQEAFALQLMIDAGRF
jgi:predicted dehydrogenase